jgi:hypothetical protein
MKESRSETWNEEIRRRCGMVDIAENVRETRLRILEMVWTRNKKR